MRTSLMISFYISPQGEEIGMLEDMEVGISDLHKVMFKITEAKTEDPSDLQPFLCGGRWGIFSLYHLFIDEQIWKDS